MESDEGRRSARHAHEELLWADTDELRLRCGELLAGYRQLAEENRKLVSEIGWWQRRVESLEDAIDHGVKVMVAFNEQVRGSSRLRVDHDERLVDPKQAAAS